MKTYKQLMEVMSMSDMNKITGGTEAQRKIAQDRQRRREAKSKGFDPNKDVLADKSSVKKPAPATKASAEKDPLKQAHDKAMAKTSGQKALPPSGSIEKTRKPDLRKSQIGKWAEGSKKAPGALAKKAATGLRKQEPIKQVDVKDVTQPKKKGNVSTPVPDKVYPAAKKNEQDPKKKGNLGKHLKGIAKGAASDAKKVAGKGLDLAKKGLSMGSEGEVDTYGEGPKQGLQQRGNQVSS